MSTVSGGSLISVTERGRAADALETERFDLAIIGGGFTGAGLAREAAMRGLSVALFESEDFASGTSSRSSKLIHGGLRYLALGEVALVRESALERKVIHRLAPHLAERRWMVLPTRSRAALLKFRAAITAYEKLGAVERDDVHQNWGVEELEREEPALDRNEWRYACAYREYLRSEEHTSELQSLRHLVCRLLLEKKKTRQHKTKAGALHGRHDRVEARRGSAVDLARDEVAAARVMNDAPWEHPGGGMREAAAEEL